MLAPWYGTAWAVNTATGVIYKCHIREKAGKKLLRAAHIAYIAPVCETHSLYEAALSDLLLFKRLAPGTTRDVGNLPWLSPNRPNSGYRPCARVITGLGFPDRAITVFIPGDRMLYYCPYFIFWGFTAQYVLRNVRTI
jgi:hypothetical protein